jgi:hypothetical protein
MRDFNCLLGRRSTNSISLESINPFFSFLISKLFNRRWVYMNCVIQMKVIQDVLSYIDRRLDKIFVRHLEIVSLKNLGDQGFPLKTLVIEVI